MAMHGAVRARFGRPARGLARLFRAFGQFFLRFFVVSRMLLRARLVAAQDSKKFDRNATLRYSQLPLKRCFLCFFIFSTPPLLLPSPSSAPL
jgi:hypothetical protein